MKYIIISCLSKFFKKHILKPIIEAVAPSICRALRGLDGEKLCQEVVCAILKLLVGKAATGNPDNDAELLEDAFDEVSKKVYVPKLQAIESQLRDGKILCDDLAGGAVDEGMAAGVLAALREDPEADDLR